MRLKSFSTTLDTLRRRFNDSSSEEDKLEKNIQDETSIKEVSLQDAKQSDEKGVEEKVFNDESFSIDVAPKPEDELSGIAKARYLTEHSSRISFYICYFSIFLLFFAISFQAECYYSLTAYATSAFAGHSLLSTIAVANNIISAAIKPPLARLSDVFGRLEAFLFSLLLYLVGLILMAASTNVQTYAGGSVLYNAGYTGVELIMTIFMADTSSMANRSLVLGISYLPFVVTIWIGPRVAQEFYMHSTWRWGIAVWTILIPACSIPFLAVYSYYQFRAWREGALKGTLTINPVELFKKLDIIGLILMTAGLALVLLSISLASYDTGKWSDAKFIVMIIIGGLCLIAFVLYEIFVASFPALPFRLMREPTIGACCAMSFLFYITFYCWDNYYYSFLQVVHYTSITAAGYISYTYSFTSCATGFFLGILIRLTKRYKWYFVASIPVYILGQGLMIRYRGEQYNWGYQIMPQIIVGIGGGVIANLLTVAVQTVVSTENFAIVTALVSTVTPIGGAVGSAISGAIWNSVMPKRLEKNLPSDLKDQAYTIFESLTVQLSYTRGTDARNAIILSYSEVQKILTSVATGFAGAMIFPVWFVANPRLSTVKTHIFDSKESKV
ncbi:Siderophore-iron transporter Str1 [Schizosaccharomyces pombe]